MEDLIGKGESFCGGGGGQSGSQVGAIPLAVTQKYHLHTQHAI